MNNMGVWYEGLRVAILQQAAKDYIEALENNDEREAADLERFFRSDWGQLLSGDKGELIIAKCKGKSVRDICAAMNHFCKK